MKKFILLFVLVFSFSIFAKENNIDIKGAKIGKWTMDFNSAIKLSKKSKTPIFLCFTGSDWCYWCKLMEKNVFKDKIHPTYKDIEFTCTCGNVIKTKSTAKNNEISICSACHPFYTGKEKILDSAGRIEKFKLKYAKQKTLKK